MSAALELAPESGAAEARRGIRDGRVTGTTAGMAPGYVQGNVVILPKAYAEEFAEFCKLNPKPCPVLGVSAVGDPMMPSLGKDFDIRHEAPRYRVWRDGVVVDEPTNVADVWRDDLVSFVLGCSYSFEEALIEDGLRIKHIDENLRVPMYRTSIDTAPAGRFFGKLVVSMRPFRPADAIRAALITARYPTVHGAPVHLGLPEQIGIMDVSKPDFGDTVPVGADELPVFWACGVTPQAAIENARPPLCITHAPGCMVITDLLNSDLAAS